MDGALKIRTAAQFRSLVQEEGESGKEEAASSALKAWQGGPRTPGLIVCQLLEITVGWLVLLSWRGEMSQEGEMHIFSPYKPVPVGAYDRV